MRLQRLPCRGPFLGTEPIVFAAYCHRCVPSQTRTCRLLRPWLIVSSFAVLSSRWSYSCIHPSSFIDNKTIQEHLWIHPKSYVRGSAPKSAIDTKVLGSSYLQEVTQCESFPQGQRQNAEATVQLEQDRTPWVEQGTVEQTKPQSINDRYNN